MVSSPKISKTEAEVLWRSMVTVPAAIAPVCTDPAAVCVLAWCPAALGGWAGWSWWPSLVSLELWKPQHFTQWRKLLFLQICNGLMNSKGIHLVHTWSSGARIKTSIKCPIPDRTIGEAVQRPGTASFFWSYFGVPHKVVMTVSNHWWALHCLSSLGSCDTKTWSWVSKLCIQGLLLKGRWIRHSVRT